jgi:hypothetical protein
MTKENQAQKVPKTNHPNHHHLHRKKKQNPLRLKNKSKLKN